MGHQRFALCGTMLETGEAEALQVIATVSVGLWGIVMALYVFVFRYFQGKTEKERFRRGRTYWTYLIEIVFFSVTTSIAIFSAVTSLILTPNGFRERIFLDIAWGTFGWNLISAMVIIVKEIRTSMKFIEPYAAPHFLIEILTKKYLKAVKKELRKVTGKEAAERYIKETMDKFLEGIGKKASETDSKPDSESKS